MQKSLQTDRKAKGILEEKYISACQCECKLHTRLVSYAFGVLDFQLGSFHLNRSQVFFKRLFLLVHQSIFPTEKDWLFNRNGNF